MSEEQRYIVLGTAGHIDHGKTTLVRSLTGIDTDTLEEEKRRGITINLGFAHFSLPDGTQVGVVDVPGHYRFIRNMVAGAVGIDMLMLVVAADDGVMPQTVEHLHIARLLGVEHGLIALTKADLVEPELLELAIADVEELVKKTFLAGKPIIPVSSVSGLGLPELRAEIQRIAGEISGQRSGEQFRMPIDRAFSVKGAGTVVTGTTASGTLKIDSELEILPLSRKVRVRGIQVHGSELREVGPGHRAALNIVGVDKDEISRGDVLIAPGSMLMTHMLDAQVELLPGSYAPLRRGSEVELHIGTAEITAKLHPLEDATIMPGGSGLVQMRFAEPIAAALGDRFIMRSSSGEITIGGGRVLDAHPTKHRRRKLEAAEQLSVLDDPADPLAPLAHEAAKKPWGIDIETAAKLLGSSPESLRRISAEAGGRGLILHISGRQAFLTAPSNRERLLAAAMRRLESYHEQNPLSLKGLSLNELAQGFAGRTHELPAEALEAALEEGVRRNALVKLKGSYALPGRSVQLSAKDNQALKTLRARITGNKPDQPDELLAELPVDKKRMGQLVRMMQEDGELISAPGAVYFASEDIEKMRAVLTDYLRRHEEGITVSDFNKLVDSSRKYGIPLLQLFENEGLLSRDGDIRRLKQGAATPVAPAGDESED